MKKNTILGILGAAGVLAFASSANAVTSEGVQVSFDGGAFQSFSLNDGDPGDLSPLPGSILHTFTISDGISLTVTITTGNTAGDSHPTMDLSLSGSINAGHFVTVELSANGFTPPSTGSYITRTTVNSDGYSVSTTTRAGTGVNGNNLWAAGGTISSFGPIKSVFDGGTGIGSGSGLAPVGTSDPYSITLTDVITGNVDGSQLHTSSLS